MVRLGEMSCLAFPVIRQLGKLYLLCSRFAMVGKVLEGFRRRLEASKARDEKVPIQPASSRNTMLGDMGNMQAKFESQITEIGFR